jgi:hypothetical protein
MANELIISYPTGATLYALLYDATGNVWNGSAFAAPGSANWLDYDLPMTEVATATGIYRASMPAVAAGVYGWTVRKQAGASPAVGDVAVGNGEIRWTGTAEETVPASANVTQVKGATISDLDSSGFVYVTLASPQQVRDAMKLGPSSGSPSTNSIDKNLTDVKTVTSQLATALEVDGSEYRFTANALELASGGLTAQETADAVNNLAPTGTPAVGSIGSHLDAILNGLTGVGLLPLIYTVTVTGTATPIEGVTVEVYTEEACINCIRRGTTNSFGVVTFWLTTTGTYWLRREKDGVTFVNPDSEIVSA